MSENTEEKPARIISKRKFLIILGLILLLGAGALYYFRSLFIVALINGQPITRLHLIQELEKQGGKQILDGIVTKTLVLQKAKKQNISISEQEINGEIQKIEENLKAQNQKLEDILAYQNTTREELVEQIRMQMILEKLVETNIEVSDEEVEEYLETNKDIFPEEMEPEEMKQTAREQLGQQKLNQEIQSLLELLRQEAQINYFVEFNF